MMELETTMNLKQYTSQELDCIKQTIEKMSNASQLKFLQLFIGHDITINENKSGIRINLGYLYQKNRSVFNEMISLLDTLETEESLFNEIENEKQILVKSLKEE